jgi:hypothetical protein
VETLTIARRHARGVISSSLHRGRASSDFAQDEVSRMAH